MPRWLGSPLCLSLWILATVLQQRAVTMKSYLHLPHGHILHLPEALAIACAAHDSFAFQCLAVTPAHAQEQLSQHRECANGCCQLVAGCVQTWIREVQ